MSTENIDPFPYIKLANDYHTFIDRFYSPPCGEITSFKTTETFGLGIEFTIYNNISEPTQFTLDIEKDSKVMLVYVETGMCELITSFRHLQRILDYYMTATTQDEDMQSADTGWE